MRQGDIDYNTENKIIIIGTSIFIFIKENRNTENQEILSNNNLFTKYTKKYI